MKQSAIGWTDFSGGDLNFVTGCTAVSAGCAHCYARSIYERFGKDFGKVTIHHDKLDRLSGTRFPEYSLRRGAPHKPMSFVCDTGDLFHEAVPDAFIDLAMQAMCTRDDVIWQVLTKRAGRMSDYFQRWCNEVRGPVPDNVWLGVTAENQQAADARIPMLLSVDARMRFVSVEPCLEAVDLSRLETSWCIVGAESGPKRRPFDGAWAIDLYEQCRAAGVPFFGKQGSGLRPGTPLELPGVGVIHEWPREASR